MRKIARILVLALVATGLVIGMAPASQGASWSRFGYDFGSTHFNPKDRLYPPLTKHWTFKTGGSIEMNPSVVGGTVYIGSDDHFVYALNANTGAVVWKFDTGGFVDSAPAVASGRVYIGSGNRKFYALDAATGRLIWSRSVPSAIESSPLVVNGIIYVAIFHGEVRAYDTSGNLRWSYRITPTGSSTKSSPAYAYGNIYISSYSPARSVFAINATTGKLRWRAQVPSSEYSSPAVAYGNVYVGDFQGYVSALDARTGKLKWRYNTKRTVYSSPAVAYGKVYVGSLNGHLYALNATTGRPVWIYNAGNQIFSSPAVNQGTVYFGTADLSGGGGMIYGLDAKSGSLLWSYPEGRYSVGAVANGALYIGGDGGQVHKFAPGPLDEGTYTDVRDIKAEPWYITRSLPTSKVSFVIERPSKVTVKVYGSKGEFRTIVKDVSRNAGPWAVLWDGKDGRGRAVVPGRYIYRIIVTNNASGATTFEWGSIWVAGKGVKVPTPLPVASVKSTIHRAWMHPTPFFPWSKTGARTTSFCYSLTQDALVTIRVASAKGVVRTVVPGLLRKAGRYYEGYTGTDDRGRVLPPGNYRYTVYAANTAGTNTFSGIVTIR